MRGLWSVSLFCFATALLAGCLSEDAAPRIDEAPTPFHFLGEALDEVEVTFSGKISTTPATGPGVHFGEAARIPLEAFVPPNVPVKVSFTFESQPWRDLLPSIDVEQGGVYHIPIPTYGLLPRDQEWRVWRTADSAVDLVLGDHAMPTPNASGGLASEWKVRLTFTADPSLLPTGFAHVVQLDPAAPLYAEVPDGVLGRLVLVHPVEGVVYRDIPHEGSVSLPAGLETGPYLLTYLTGDPVRLSGGFLGPAVPATMQEEVQETVQAYGGLPSSWTEATERTPWRVGFVSDRMFGMDNGEARWRIEWAGETVYDPGAEREPFMYGSVDCVACSGKQGTDMFRSTLGPGEYTFTIDQLVGRGEARAYFTYIDVEEALGRIQTG